MSQQHLRASSTEDDSLRVDPLSVSLSARLHVAFPTVPCPPQPRQPTQPFRNSFDNLEHAVHSISNPTFATPFTGHRFQGIQGHSFDQDSTN